MSSIKAWLYSGRSTAPAPSSPSNETPGKSDTSKASSLADMSERSRAAAAGKAGEHFADMALGDGFGALVSFDSTSSVPHLGEDAVAAASEEITLGAVEDADANTNAHPPSDPTTFAAAAAAETTELPNPLEGRNSMAQVVPEPDFLLDADGFGAILCAEMAMEQKDVPATMPPPAPSGALYPEVANWLANACANDGTAGKTALNASSDKGITGKSRPSLIQRIDRYLFPPSKLIVDGTLLPSPASPPKLNGNGSKLEVDFPRMEGKVLPTLLTRSVIGVLSEQPGWGLLLVLSLDALLT